MAENPYLQFLPQQQEAPPAGPQAENPYLQFVPQQELEQEKEKNPLWYDMVTSAPGSFVGLVVDSAVGASRLLMNPAGVGRDIARAGIGNIASEMVRPYTSAENFEETLRTDPLRPVADASALISGGGVGLRAAAATGRLPAAVGRAAGVAERVGAATDPLVAGITGASKVAGGVKTGVQGFIGGATGSHGAIAESGARGYDAAYSGVANQLDRALSAVTGKHVLTQSLKEGKRGAEVLKSARKGKPLFDMDEVATDMSKAARDKAGEQYRVRRDAVLDQVKDADWQPIADALQEARRSPGAIHEGGRPKAAANEYLDFAEQVFREYSRPAMPSGLPGNVKVSALLSGRKPKGMSDPVWQAVKAERPLLRKQYKELKNALDVPDFTVQEFADAFAAERQSARGMDAFRRIIRNEGEKIGKRLDDRSIKQLLAKTNDNIIDVLETQAQAKGVAGYKDNLTAFRQDMNAIDEFERTFSLKSGAPDVIERKISAILRNGVFTNYTGRLRTMEDMVELVKDRVPDAQNITASAAGAATQASFRPNMWGLFTGNIPLLGVVATGNPAWATAALPAILVHSPKAMGKAAFQTGKVQGLVMKPLNATAKLLGDVQRKYLNDQVLVTGRGALRSAGQIQRLMDSWEQNRNDELVKELVSRSQAAGFNIDQSTFRRLVRDLNSGEAKPFMRALETIGRNKRLMQVFEGSDLANSLTKE